MAYLALRIRGVLVSFRAAARDMASIGGGLEVSRRGLTLLDHIEADMSPDEWIGLRDALEYARAEISSTREWQEPSTATWAPRRGQESIDLRS